MIGQRSQKDEQLNIDISDIEENDDVYFETTSKKLRQKLKTP